MSDYELRPWQRDLLDRIRRDEPLAMVTPRQSGDRRLLREMALLLMAIDERERPRQDSNLRPSP